MVGGAWKDAEETLETFRDTKGYNSAGELLMSTRGGWGKRAPALTTITTFRASRGQNLLRPIMSMKQRAA